MLLKLQVQYIVYSTILNLLLTDAHTTTVANSGSKHNLLHNVEATTSTTLRLSQQLPRATNAYQPYQENFSNDNVKFDNNDDNNDEDDGIKQSSLTMHQTTSKVNHHHSRKRDGDGTQSFSSLTSKKDNDIENVKIKNDENAGFLLFETKEKPEKITENGLGVNQVLLNLFPQGFSNIFGFSHASEPTTTTMRIPTFKKFSSSLDQLVKKLHRNVKTTENPKDSIIYGIEASISKEYQGNPGHREVIAEKITLDAPNINEKDFLPHGDILKINRAVTKPADIAEEPKTKTSTDYQDNNAYFVLGEITEESEDLLAEEEDNKLAESGKIYVQSLQNPPLSNQQNLYYSDPRTNYNMYDFQRQNKEIYQQLNSLQELPSQAQYSASFSSRDNPNDMSSGASNAENIASETLNTNITYDQYSEPDGKQQYNESFEGDNVTPNNIVFVTIGSDLEGQSDNKVSSDAEYANAGSEIQEQHINRPRTEVEVQKSINVRNKLITEQNGRLLEMHETIYHDTNNDERISIQQQYMQSQPAEQNYVSLSERPIHVPAADFAKIDEEKPQREDNSMPEDSYKAIRHTFDNSIHTYNSSNNQQNHEDPLVFYPIQGNPFTNQIYPLQEFMPQGYAVSYQEAIGVPLHYQHYINHPYKHETIVEKPIPYPVEKIVEKVVEKHVPVEVERFVEKPTKTTTEKTLNKGVMPVPVAFPIPMPPKSNSQHPGNLTQSYSAIYSIPVKVWQNYLLTKMMANANLKKPGAPKKAIKGDLKSAPFKTGAFSLNPKLKHKTPDLRSIDLFPPPPPYSSSNTRYIYNTLPKSYAPLSAPTTSYGNRFVRTMSMPMQMQGDVMMNDELRWKNGHVLKRSASNINQPNIEYGFKPPLVPSVEIDDAGVPLNANGDPKH